MMLCFASVQISIQLLSCPMCAFIHLFGSVSLFSCVHSPSLHTCLFISFPLPCMCVCVCGFFSSLLMAFLSSSRNTSHMPCLCSTIPEKPTLFTLFRRPWLKQGTHSLALTFCCTVLLPFFCPLCTWLGNVARVCQSGQLASYKGLFSRWHQRPLSPFTYRRGTRPC